MFEPDQVVSGPTRKLSMPTDSKSYEVDKELGEIRREVIEARNLVIKTDNLLKNLHAELKMVGKRQEDFQRRQWISSGAAYLGFAALCVAGAIMLSSARTATATGERERLEKEVTDLRSQLEKQRGETNAMAQAQRSAAEVYKLMTTLPGDERLKGVDALVKLDTTKLSALERQALTDRAELLRREIGQAAFERGKSAFRRNEFPDTVKELSRFLAMNPSAEERLDASFFLGTALNQLRKHADAVTHLTHFITEDKRSRTRDYAMLLLAQSLQETNQLDKAADICRDALGTYPNSQFASQFRGRLSSVKRQAAGEAAAGGVEVSPAGVPPGTQQAAAPAPAGAPPAATATPNPR
jgi:TolA-binding protein